MNTLSADQSEDPTFIHSRVDDLGLTMAEFRVYCHLKRRATHGVAWPGIDSMAKICRANKRTIIKAIKSLEKRKMLVVTRVDGEGNRYRLTKPSQWIGQCILGNATSAEEVTVQCTIGNGDQSILGNERVSSTEGNPLKVTPYSPPKGSKQSTSLNGHFPQTPDGSSPKGDGKVTKRFQYPKEFEVFWSAYPDTNASKFETYQTWNRLKPPLDQCLEAVGVFKKTDSWKRGFVEYPIRWLKGRQWELEES
jgi:hypothetical protein